MHPSYRNIFRVLVAVCRHHTLGLPGEYTRSSVTSHKSVPRLYAGTQYCSHGLSGETVSGTDRLRRRVTVVWATGRVVVEATIRSLSASHGGSSTKWTRRVYDNQQLTAIRRGRAAQVCWEGGGGGGGATSKKQKNTALFCHHRTPPAALPARMPVNAFRTKINCQKQAVPRHTQCFSSHSKLRGTYKRRVQFVRPDFLGSTGLVYVYVIHSAQY